jgi:hypothetical protein
VVVEELLLILLDNLEDLEVELEEQTQDLI